MEVEVDNDKCETPGERSSNVTIMSMRGIGEGLGIEMRMGGGDDV